MRKFLAVLFLGLVVAVVHGAQAGGSKVAVKGPHICCAQCSKVVDDILSKVDGVSDIKPSRKPMEVTFTAKDDKAAKAGFKALVDGGFFGQASADGKEFNLVMAAVKKGDKADVVTVKDVHVCCGACQNAIKKVFNTSKVTFDGDGPQRSVRIEGKDLDCAEVLETLHKTGFNGSVEK